jgi:hypothetical protein
VPFCSCCGLPPGHAACAIKVGAPSVPKVNTRRAKKNFLTVAQCNVLATRLVVLREALLNDADDIVALSMPLKAFVPKHTIKKISDHYALIHTLADLLPHIQDIPLLLSHSARLLSCILDSKPALESARANAATAQQAKQTQDPPGMDTGIANPVRSLAVDVEQMVSASAPFKAEGIQNEL